MPGGCASPLICCFTFEGGQEKEAGNEGDKRKREKDLLSTEKRRVVAIPSGGRNCRKLPQEEKRL